MEPPFFILRGHDLDDALDDLCLQRLRYLLEDDFITEVMQEDVDPSDIREVKDAVALVIKYFDWSAPDFDGRGYVEWYEKSAENDKHKKLSVKLDIYHTHVIIQALQRMKKDLLEGSQVDGTDELIDIIQDVKNEIRKKQLGLLSYFDNYPDTKNKILRDIDYMHKALK